MTDERARRTLCNITDLAATGCRDFRLGGGEWPLKGFVVQSATGIHAYVNRCAHLAYPLNDEPHRYLTADGTAILCHAHGALYDRSTGRCFAGPCIGRALIALEICVTDGLVLLAAGQDVDALAARHA